MTTKKLTAVRLDTTSMAILKDLSTNLSSNKSQIMRSSLRVFKALNDVQSEHGQIKLKKETGEELLILLG